MDNLKGAVSPFLIIGALVCAGIVQGCSDAAVDVPASEAETSESETFSSKKEDVLMDDSPPPGWDEGLANQFFESEEKAQLDSLNLDAFHRIHAAMNRGVAEEELAEAFKDELNGTENADSTAGEYLFLSNADAEIYLEELLAAQNALAMAFPLLLNEDPGPDFNSSELCEITAQAVEDFFARFDAIYAYETGSIVAQDFLAGGVCGGWGNRLKLGACALGCGLTTAGLGAALCGWMCWCTFCKTNSVLAGAICPQE